MKPIYIHKGDDTVFGQITKFLSFKIVTSDDLGGYKAEFRLRRIIKKINSLDNNEFEVILTSEETNKLEYGKCFGEVKLVDPEGHIKTFCNTIPFVITPKVIDSQEGEIELELTNSPEYSLILKIGDNTAGVSNYVDLKDKPQINGVELVGNKTTADLKIDVDTSNLATKEELKEVEDKIPDVDNLATKDEIPTVPTKVSDLENDSGFLNKIDLTGVLQGGNYIDVYKPSAETLYEYKSVFDETNIGMVTANNVTCFTNQFDYMINEMSETTQLEQPVSEMYAYKLNEEQIKHIVPLLKADKTPYTLLECINDSLFTANGITDLTRENKINMLNAMTGGNVDPDTTAYAIQMKAESPFFSSCLFSVYQDKFGNYIIGIIVGWHVTPVSETQVGEAGDYYIVDFNNQAKDLINNIKAQIGDIETALAEV